MINPDNDISFTMSRIFIDILTRTLSIKILKLSDDVGYFCICFEGKYTNPPNEDWIQCSVWIKWCYEECSNKWTGKHINDLCRRQ